METIEFYKAFIAVFNYVGEGHTLISASKGEELAGLYWPRIFRLMREEKAGVGDADGTFQVTKGIFLNPVYADCLYAIKEIEAEKAYRELDINDKKVHIEYAVKAHRLSKWAIAISVIAIIVEAISQSLRLL